MIQTRSRDQVEVTGQLSSLVSTQGVTLVSGPTVIYDTEDGSSFEIVNFNVSPLSAGPISVWILDSNETATAASNNRINGLTISAPTRLDALTGLAVMPGGQILASASSGSLSVMVTGIRRYAGV